MEALRLTDNWPRQATPSVPRVVLLRSPCQWSAVQPIKIGARRSPVTTYRRRTPRSAARVVASRSQRCSLLRVAPSSQHSMRSMTHRAYGEKRKGLAEPVRRQSPNKVGASRSTVTAFTLRGKKEESGACHASAAPVNHQPVAPVAAQSLHATVVGGVGTVLAVPVLRQSATNMWRQSQPSHCIPPCVPIQSPSIQSSHGHRSRGCM